MSRDELEAPINASREADANRWGTSWTPVREEAAERLGLVGAAGIDTAGGIKS